MGDDMSHADGGAEVVGIKIADRIGFASGKHTKVDLFRGSHLFVGLNCFEPGQSQTTHAHHGADKFYLIVSGKARMVVADRRWIAEAGEVVWAAAEVPHGVEEALERTVMLVAISPPPGGGR